MQQQTLLDGGPVSKDFILAGKAIFTVANPQGEHYTYRVSAPKQGGDIRFVSLLTGPDNTGDYTYLGLLKAGSGDVVATAKSKLSTTSRPFAVAQFAVNVVFGKRPLPAGYRLIHAGRCGRCARLLTVPESVETGFGPECAGKLGL
jgi:hypothetical protein